MRCTRSNISQNSRYVILMLVDHTLMYPQACPNTADKIMTFISPTEQKRIGEWTCMLGRCGFISTKLQPANLISEYPHIYGSYSRHLDFCLVSLAPTVSVRSLIHIPSAHKTDLPDTGQYLQYPAGYILQYPAGYRGSDITTTQLNVTEKFFIK